jgi:hypothetical protein
MSWFGDAADPRKSNELAAFYANLAIAAAAAGQNQHDWAKRR